jgi:hypothetical protein
MTKSDLQIVLSTWGPIKVAIDEQTQKSWNKISQESLRKTLITLQVNEAPTQAHSQRDDNAEPISACG